MPRLKENTKRPFAYPTAKDLTRFWSKVDVRDGDECWEWTAATSNGYGAFGFCRRVIGAHRFAWMIRYGPIPARTGVLHSCDNPACVRYDHLFLGTNAQNSADSVAKDRHARGERNHFARLKEQQVIEMRATYARGGITQRELAAHYGVTTRTAEMILTNRTWRHLL